MDIPPPSVPEARLTDWRQTDQTVDSPFSTPFVSVYTHTRVYEETTQRRAIREQTGIDQSWRFFFASRIRLDPGQSPSRLLTSVIRPKVSAAFVDRLSARGFESIREVDRRRVDIGRNRGTQKQYRARCRLTPTDGPTLELPVEGSLAVWADDDYHVAGGAYPAGRPQSGPAKVVAALKDMIDPTVAREELRLLIKGCGEPRSE